MDHDRLFKELLTNFFFEFIELFVPQMAAEMDRSSIEFLDKEVFNDPPTGDRHEVDLLVKVRLSEREVFILVHVENQSTWQADFPKRMFKYYSVLLVRHDLPVYPIAIFSYDRPLTPASDRFDLELFDRPILKFEFHAIQLNRLNWRDFLSRPNPVASALMAKMNIAAEDQIRVTLECVRMLVTLKLKPARSQMIGDFMLSYLKFTGAELVRYIQSSDLVSYQEKENIMELLNPMVEMGREEGLQQGRVQGRLEGRVEGRVAILLRQFRRRFGSLPVGLPDQIAHLTDLQLDDLAEALFDFHTIADAQAWLEQH
jgi:predicted transposase YdaD